MSFVAAFLIARFRATAAFFFATLRTAEAASFFATGAFRDVDDFADFLPILFEAAFFFAMTVTFPGRILRDFVNRPRIDAEEILRLTNRRRQCQQIQFCSSCRLLKRRIPPFVCHN
jgi:hypothetical protein